MSRHAIVRCMQYLLTSCRMTGPDDAGAAVAGGPQDITHVRLEVFDITGRRVRSLVSGSLGAGLHEALWDGHDDEGRRDGTGVYLVRLEADGRRASRRVVLTH